MPSYLMYVEPSHNTLIGGVMCHLKKRKRRSLTHRRFRWRYLVGLRRRKTFSLAPC